MTVTEAVEVSQLTAIAAAPVIELSGLSKQFGSQVILDDFALTVRKGEFVALLGRSGTGKTTLLRILAGLEDATSGHLRITRRSSVVFQEPRLIQAQRVWKNVVLSTSRSDAVYRRAIGALTEVGLADKAKAWPKSLSGGEAQRVGLARALFRSPDLLLLDEPFGALDAFTRRTAQDLVTTLWQEHQVGVLLVTHDIEEAVLLADRIVVLGHGTIQADIPVHLDRPRDVTSAEFNDIKRAVLNSLAISSQEANTDNPGS
ncbi:MULTISPECIES: ABC transporter ATP-binding protein [Mycolicibacterium]|uniref:Putative aliphatic sulfonates transport ATP-binding protein SsuB n=1 Tax=Mycolicibacterium smegmatis (strain MKD8) TaxID=1214915 RepID=A0A2U9PUH0_MYCSE|nr:MULTISPECIES: ABC transporter ATP-binding protein [Mycolicibacterium]AWT55436.1 putative aliphatic sulfonates transport ATP-binding protein SsuB [Mycolicibacterium smegmatis MKD8]MBU8815070.1 ABC transporter ATP-binding protein [Mycolicibacterium goodii]PJK22379.1 ABC transporter ATP-binding protein [Mycolicibacterium goodii]